ncbi:hypothetical protein [Lysinibacillus halotolerans]|uniref:Uncharacterized protein n=1 Tax=Lysinibacillus halotolerans TaxID=1368476 RepID=A0A3M8HFL6_9BACI|nr:hypothetical protein [Lysinibacillus halotolerans]RND01200.1 hypothetical protein EC501_02820 [Lysinibacillus halotolerans]
MKKGKIVFLGTFVLLSFIVFLFTNNSLSKGETSEVSETSPKLLAENDKKQKEAEEIQNLLQEEDGFLEQVSNRLVEKGYEFSTMLAVFSSEDIQVKYIVSNKEVTETDQETIKSIFNELIEKNNFDADSFSIKVADSNDGPDW